MSDDSTTSDSDDETVSETELPETTRRGILVLILATLSAAVIWLLDSIIPGGITVDGYGSDGYGEGGFGE